MASASTNLPAPTGVAEVEAMAPLTYRGLRVLTTALAAVAFEAGEKQLQDNHANNRDRFIEGKHLFVVKGAELKALKRQPDFIGVAHKFASQIYLWTDRGIARHAKILETDVAWEIYERLEDRYFGGEADSVPAGSPTPKPISPAELRRQHAYWLAIAERTGIDASAALFSANRMTRKATGVDVLAEMGQPLLPSPADEVVLPPTAFCAELGVSRNEINRLITHHGYQTDHRDHKDRLYYELTDKGREAGGRGLDRNIEHDKGTTMKVELKWPRSIVDRLRADVLAEAH